MIIAICGKKGSGKDTIGNYLCEKYDFLKLNFADPLKEACKHIFELTDEQLYGDKKEIIDEYWNITPREIMQFVGTELLREQLKNKFNNIGSNIWTMLMKKKIANILEKNSEQNIVISDLRFLNEYNLLNSLNGVILKVTNNNVKNFIGNTHESETEMDNIKYNYIIENNLELSDLYEKIDFLMHKNIIL
jgi:dephospho-CoA kinase